MGHRNNRPDNPWSRPGMMVAMATSRRKDPQVLQRKRPIFQSSRGQAHWNQRSHVWGWWIGWWKGGGRVDRFTWSSSEALMWPSPSVSKFLNKNCVKFPSFQFFCSQILIPGIVLVISCHSNDDTNASSFLTKSLHDDDNINIIDSGPRNCDTLCVDA